MLKEVSGGVCAAKGFRAAGIRCGVKTKIAEGDGNQPVVSSMKDYLSGKKDLAMILSECDCTAAAVHSQSDKIIARSFFPVR